MIRTLPDYIQRGGTKLAIAKTWGVSAQYVGDLVKGTPGLYQVEFNPMNPRSVLKFWRDEVKKTVPKKVFFDVSKDE